MKMSKKKRRTTNTFLQSKNKKNVDSSKTKEYSPIKFDCFGRESRFVNRRGDVLLTDTEMFGCEIVRDLPNYLRDYLNLIGLGEVIRVPVTNHEYLTGSGKKGECHTNSSLLSLSVGGHRLYGYSLSQRGESLSNIDFKENIRLHSHSVWITPEGKTRCVTDYRLDKDLEYNLFIPVGLNDIEDTFRVQNRYVELASSKNEVYFLDYDYNLEERVKMKNLKKYIKLKGSHNIIFKNLIRTTTETRLTTWKEDIENSNFGKVSTSTGRSWDYFKNKILNTYYPTSQTP